MRIRDLPAVVAFLALVACSQSDDASGKRAAVQDSTNKPATAASQSIAAAQAAPEKLPMPDETAILNDPHGQWAIEASSSSAYHDARGHDAFAAWQATGAPNVPAYLDSVDSWAPLRADSPEEWLEVRFAKPVRARALRVRQNLNPGAIARIELLATDGTAHELYRVEPATLGPGPKTVVWLSQDFPVTGYAVNGARITLASDRVFGWNEIDAVQLVGE